MGNVRPIAMTPGTMQPPRPQSRWSRTSMSPKYSTDLSHILRISPRAQVPGQALMDEDDDGLGGMLSRDYEAIDDSEDAFVIPPDDEAVNEFSSEMTISALVRKCDKPPRLQLFTKSSQQAMESLMNDLDRLKRASEGFMSTTMHGSYNLGNSQNESSNAELIPAWRGQLR
eukprot:c19558_g1_i4.p1 GENE.c19558_g1_i4~~c19558_g1_i4.p1  ORF type:complete len:171 (+),score=35.97 c19558_g1_i4:2-514(+)